MGAGDKLAVVCWYGSTEYERSTSTITPRGDIYLKLIGSIAVSRKTLGQLREELNRRYAKYYQTFSLTVDLVGQRTMPVFVTGEVRKPGKYFLSSMATAFTALYSAGGPNAIGSLRHIAVMRGQHAAGVIDVYEYLLQGKSVDLPLQSGDTLYVPPVGAVVTLAGEVRRPASYEVPAGISLSAAATLAGGLTPVCSNRIQILRIDAVKGRQLLDRHLPADAALLLQDGDIVVAQPVVEHLPNAVSIRGEVYRPGEYACETAPTVAALITLADGVTPDAFLHQAHLRRLRANNEPVIISVDLEAALAGDARANLSLLPRDELIVYSRKELTEVLDSVSIEGEIAKPGVYPFRQGMLVSDLVTQAFGITKNAYLPQAFLYHFDSKSGTSLVSIDLERALTGDSGRQSPALLARPIRDSFARDDEVAAG